MRRVLKLLKLLILPVALFALAQPVLAAEMQPHANPAPAAKSMPASSGEAPSLSPKSVPGDAPYTICPGDVLQITVWKEDSLNKEILVLTDGTISFPLIGSFNVAGMTPAQVQATVQQKLEPYIPDAAVTVMVKADLGHTVNVIGQVTKPGEIMMGHRLTVMEALSQAGGLTPYADEGRIIVLHHNKQGKEISIPFPYGDIVEGDDLDKDIVLSPGDVVVVPTAGLL